MNALPSAELSPGLAHPRAQGILLAGCSLCSLSHHLQVLSLLVSLNLPVSAALRSLSCSTEGPLCSMALGQGDIASQGCEQAGGDDTFSKHCLTLLSSNTLQEGEMIIVQSPSCPQGPHRPSVATLLGSVGSDGAVELSQGPLSQGPLPREL